MRAIPAILTQRRLRVLLVAVAMAGLALGFLARLAGMPDLAPWFWGVATAPVLAALLVQIVTSLRRGDLGLDIVALLSMSGALILGETLAGAVVALMYAGGQFLEDIAENRARREMTALLSRVPTTAMRHRDGGLETVPIAAIRPGDRLLIRQGEVIPVDGTVAAGTATLDQSTVTGEALPVERQIGEAAMSGTTSLGNAFDLAATETAAASTYAGIVRLVEAAQQAKAPMVRLADRYAIWFLLATCLIAGGAWLATGEAIRALAVLVVATPCPLILAVPVAIISGVSVAARRGVLVKGGGVLETLGRVRTLVIDKTGTLTSGGLALIASERADGFGEDELLRLAASLDQASGHVVAAALVAAARARGLRLDPPTEVREAPGSGIEGRVDGRHVVAGDVGYVCRSAGCQNRFATVAQPSGAVTVAVAVDRVLAGLLVFADAIRPEVPAALAEFRRRGISRIVLASGDRRETAEAVGARLALDEVHADLSPADKVTLVQAERAHGAVMMVGDGVNDAPALAAADVGIAMGVRGAAASSEAADAVLLVDRLDRLAEALAIAVRSRRIALQSVYAGIGLSLAAMGFAAFGYLAPVEGALIQEGIDVAVILNSLRALGGRSRRGAIPATSDKR